MRLGAAIIDGVVAAVLVAVPTWLLAKIHPALGAVVGGLLAMGYYSLEVFKAQAVGKMLFKYQIAAQDGSPATREQLVKRYAFKQIPQALFILAAIPFLGVVSFLGLAAAVAIAIGGLQLFKPERLAWHDKLFGTAVYGPKTISVTIPSAAELLPASTPIASAVEPTPKAA